MKKISTKFYNYENSKELFETSKSPVINFDIEDIDNILNLNDSKQEITGVQRKLSLHLSNEKEKRLTLYDEPKGYILKFEPNSSLMAIDEFVTMSLANIAGIKTVKFGLIKLNEKQFGYITKRLDRDGNQKIHMEDFCQLSNKLTEQKYSGSYEYVGKILKQYSDISKNKSLLELIQLFRILLFSYIVGNSDMHLKNFSLLEDEIIHLAPAYDLINVHLLINDMDDLALSLNGKQRKLTKNDFINYGENIGLNKKIILKNINYMMSLKEDFIEFIKTSLLDEDNKQKYIDEIIYKTNVLVKSKTSM